MLRAIRLSLLRFLQSYCEHPGDAVKADILEGRLCSMAGVQWCEMCGAYRHFDEHARWFSEWRTPRPDYHRPRRSLLSNGQIGNLRRALLIKRESRWNAIVRDVTAKLG